MLRPETPPNETARLLALRALDILDTVAEERFDRVTRLACRLFEVPIALVSLVDAERQWFKSKQGLAARETSREISFCGHAVATDGLLVVSNAADDVRFCDNPLVVGDPSIRFYAGRPVHADDGQPVGTLCLIDRRPREMTAEELQLLDDLGSMIEDELRSLSSSTTDPLTGLSNRRGFDVLASKSLALARRLAGPMTLLVFDLDGFKTINDELGHAAGDRALVDFAGALLSTFREADLIARLGGDEFCVLACGPSEGMRAPLDRLATALDRLGDRPYRVAFSVGAAECRPDRRTTIEALMDEADRSMYAHKRRLRPTG